MEWSSIQRQEILAYIKEMALLEGGFSSDDFRIQEADQQIGNVKQLALQYLREHPETDAIFSTNNMMTLEVIGAIKELNLNIPSDIAVVGYDETVWSKYLDPPLTTILQPGYQMGQIAVRMLHKSFHAKRKLKPETIMLEPKLIIRKSCGAAPDYLQP